MTDVQTWPRLCGRPTASKKPCRQTLYGRRLACGVHETERDKELIKMFEVGYREGYEAGERSGRDSVLMEERFAARKEAREAEERRNFRTHDAAGRQLVTVAGGYTYAWSGSEPLSVGDIVTLPPGYDLHPWESAVTGLGSSYTGYVKEILGRYQG